MNDIRHEFLEIVKQVRTHLEYQRALGVNVIETGTTVNRQCKASVERTPNPPVSLSANGGADGIPGVKKVCEKDNQASSSPLNAVLSEIGDCTRCKLSKGRKNIVFGEGNAKASLVFVGEGPGQEEDEQGRPFVGAAGQLLTDIIVKGMKLAREDVYICNIVKCRPPGNRNPEPDEIGACEGFLVKQLQAIRPKVIVALGNVAVKTLLKTSEGITSVRGKWKIYQGIPLMPTFHPAYLLRNPGGKKFVWEDIKKVIEAMEKCQESGGIQE